MEQIDKVLVDLCGNDYLKPYIMREMGVIDDDEPVMAVAAVRVVTDETEVNADTALDDVFAQRQLPLAVVRVPYIVGTGMTGLLHRIAAGIWRGTFVHIKANDARISVAHATDVARAVAMMAGTQGVYTLTDNVNPTIHDLAEALAYRLDDKRIITIKPRWARLWLGREFYDQLTTDHIADNTLCVACPELQPVSVTEYLRTHVYDEQSL